MSQVRTIGRSRYKRGRTVTIRGAFPWSTTIQDMAELNKPHRIRLSNGSFRDNFIIEDVQFIINQPDGTYEYLDNDCHSMMMGTSRESVLPGFATPSVIGGATLRDSQQVWWGSMSGVHEPMSVLDIDHLFVEDLWIGGWFIDSDSGVRYSLNQEIGYLITLRAVRTTINEAILALIKERAQNTLGAGF